MDPYTARYAFFWYNDEEIFFDSQEDIDRKVKSYADQGITHLMTFSCTHFRWSFKPFWGILNECLTKIVRAAHKYGLKVVEHHSSELAHLADTPEQLQRLKNILSFRKSSLDSWKGLTDFLQDKNSEANKWVQINEKTGLPNVNVYMGTGKCYNDPEYRKEYLTYLESVYATGVDGIMTDDVQYYCFCTCEHCRKGFKEKYGHTLPSPEKWDEWFGNMRDISFVDFLRFRIDSTHNFHVMVKEHYDSLGLKLLRPNYLSFAFSNDHQSCGIDELPEMHWYFQECAISCIPRYSFLKSAGEQKHRAMIAKQRKIPHGILNYAYNHDDLVFTWAVAMLSGGFYVNTPEGGDPVDETLIRSFEKKYSSSLFHCEEFSPVGFLHSYGNRVFSPGDNMSRMEVWLQMCLLRNRPCIMVNANDPESWKKCSLISINEVHMLSDKEIFELKKYVEDGGNILLSGQCGTQKETAVVRTKEELEAVWGFSFDAREGSSPVILPRGKGKICIIPDFFGYPLNEEDIAKMFKTDHMDIPFMEMPYELMRNAPFVTGNTRNKTEKRKHNITEIYHALMKSSQEVMALFDTLAPSDFSASVPDGLLVSPFRSTEENTLSIRLLNTKEALITDEAGVVSRGDTVKWKKLDEVDSVFSFVLSAGEKVTGCFFTDLTGKEVPLSFEEAMPHQWKVTLPAGSMQDFGYIILQLGKTNP